MRTPKKNDADGAEREYGGKMMGILGEVCLSLLNCQERGHGGSL